MQEIYKKDLFPMESLISKIERDLRIKVKDRVLQLIQNSSFRGYRIEDVVAATTYIAIKEKGYLISYREFLKYCKLLITSRRAVFRIISKIVKEQNIKFASNNLDALVEKYARIFKLSPLEKKKAKDIAKIIYKTGRNPLGIVATSIYLVRKQNGREIAKTEIAKALGITPVTIRKNIFDYFKKINSLSFYKYL